MAMIPVLLASPWSGDVVRHREYAIACVLDSIARDEAPLAPHLLYPQALLDEDPKQRDAGISCGLAWLQVAMVLVVYADLGRSPGMLHEIARAVGMGARIEYRRIGGGW